MPIFSQDYNIEFNAKIYDGKWGRYIGVSDQGPFCYEESKIVFIDENNTLIILTSNGESVKQIPLHSESSEIYKINNEIFVSQNELIFKLIENSLVLFDDDLMIMDGLYFNFSDGLFSCKNNKKKKILFQNKSLTPGVCCELPVVSGDRKHIYFTVRSNNFAGDLYKYSIAENEFSMIKNNVSHISFLSDNSLLLYVVESNYSRLFMSEYPGDFAVLNTNTDSIDYNSDLSLYNNGIEYSVNDFDSNSKGFVVAFGGFIKFDGRKIVESYKPVITLNVTKRDK